MHERYEYIKAWAAKNREKRNASQRKYYHADVERGRAIGKKHYHANKEVWNARRKAWRKSNPGKLAAQNHRRRDRRNGVEECDPASACVLAQLIDSAARMKCGLCGKNMPKHDRTIDHVIPLAKGGTGHIANIQIVHLSCNCKKRAKLPVDLTGQHEINFAGNGAYPNKSEERANGGTLESTFHANSQTKFK